MRGTRSSKSAAVPALPGAGPRRRGRASPLQSTWGPISDSGNVTRPQSFESTSRELRPRITGDETAMSHQGAFESILASLHEAAFDDAHWPTATVLLDDACRTKGNYIILGTWLPDGSLDISFSRLFYRGEHNTELEREYFNTYYHVDERVPRVRRLPDSQIARVPDLYSESERKSSPVYNEALVRGECQNGLNVRLDGPEGSELAWATSDPIDGSWSSAQLDLLERLLPHIRQVFRVRYALAEAGALRTSLAGLLDNTRAGVIQLDRQGRIAAANDRARDVLRQGDGLSDQDGLLRAGVTKEHAELQRLLARALPRFGEAAEGGSMTLSRASGLPRLVLHVSPVEDRDAEFRSRRVAALVLIVDPRRRARIERALVGSALGLTRAESEVAAALAEGSPIRQIAATTGRGESTIRWHLKHIFDKLGISRQIEVAQLVLPLAGLPPPRR